jgi:hypothetical protein
MSLARAAASSAVLPLISMAKSAPPRRQIRDELSLQAVRRMAAVCRSSSSLRAPAVTYDLAHIRDFETGAHLDRMAC